MQIATIGADQIINPSQSKPAYQEIKSADWTGRTLQILGSVSGVSNLIDSYNDVKKGDYTSAAKNLRTSAAKGACVALTIYALCELFGRTGLDFVSSDCSASSYPKDWDLFRRTRGTAKYAVEIGSEHYNVMVGKCTYKNGGTTVIEKILSFPHHDNVTSLGQACLRVVDDAGKIFHSEAINITKTGIFNIYDTLKIEC